jgi:multidrug efflux pump subunit AcrA (membrane-fusion protein)
MAGQTTYYQLETYESTDVPDLRDQYNGSMVKIDAALNTIANTAAGAAAGVNQAVQNAQTALNSASAALTAANNANTAASQASAAALAADTTAQQAATDATTALNSASTANNAISGLTSRVNALETSIDADTITGLLPATTYCSNYLASNGTATIPLESNETYLLIATHNSTRAINGIAIIPQGAANVWVQSGCDGITFNHTGNTLIATNSDGGNPVYHMIKLF